MTPPVALAAVLALLALASVLGAFLKRRGGRVREVDSGARIDPVDFGATEFGADGSVVQFSTEYCARCPGVRRQLSELVRDRAALTFLHVDVTDDPGLARKYGLLQTPTVLLIDGSGAPRAHLSGPLSRATLTHALENFTGGTP